MYTVLCILLQSIWLCVIISGALMSTLMFLYCSCTCPVYSCSKFKTLLKLLPSAEELKALMRLSLTFCTGLIVFLSMMLGAFLWGGLADKVGRRRCLIMALAINCIFAFLSSFAQGYGFFLFFRLLSGIG